MRIIFLLMLLISFSAFAMDDEEDHKNETTPSPFMQEVIRRLEILSAQQMEDITEGEGEEEFDQDPEVTLRVARCNEYPVDIDDAADGMELEEKQVSRPTAESTLTVPMDRYLPVMRTPPPPKLQRSLSDLINGAYDLYLQAYQVRRTSRDEAGLALLYQGATHWEDDVAVAIGIEDGARHGRIKKKNELVSCIMNRQQRPQDNRPGWNQTQSVPPLVTRDTVITVTDEKGFVVHHSQ